MAGGGVGEAMLIGAAVGAGTGAVGSAVQDKDIGQGALMGGLMGAATGGIGSQLGGATSTALQNAATPSLEAGLTSAGGDVLANTGTNAAGTMAEQELAAKTIEQGVNQGITDTGTQTAGKEFAMFGGDKAAGNWGQQGLGQGMFPGMTNAQVAGATTAGGISGLASASSQPAPYQAPEQEQYNGPLSQFKMAGPSLSQYNYNPSTFQPSIAPGYADGGIATLQTDMFPQSQMDRTQFATPTQMPVSREVIASDYDSTISPYTGDIPRFADGGGIGFVRNLQPGGAFGDATSEMYGAVDEALPFLKDITPGGFMGALQPGRMDWEDKKRKEEEEKAAKDRAMQEAKAAAMYNQMAGGNPQAGGSMARGGIADLGSYSDGGRLLRGPGDGMSDDIPASIAGKQPARLADGEFVVPADVVSHLGNGSTDAGAKTLYGMMDKVRKARTGSKKQGRDINPDKYVPKMAGGGIACFDEGGETTDQPVQETAPAAPAPAYNPSVYNPTTYNYSAYTKANRPSGNDPQYYGDIYQGAIPDYSTPGYTLTGGNLGRWSNVAGEAQRAAQPASMNQQVTQSYLQNLGRAPDQSGFNYWMNSGLTAPQVNQAIQQSPEAYNISPTQNEANYIAGLYKQYLGRDPEQEGSNYWQQQLGEKINAQQLQAAIQNSEEGKAYAASKSTNKRRGGILDLHRA